RRPVHKSRPLKSRRSYCAKLNPSPRRSGVLSCHSLSAYRPLTFSRPTGQLFCSNFFKDASGDPEEERRRWRQLSPFARDFLRRRCDFRACRETVVRGPESCPARLRFLTLRWPKPFATGQENVVMSMAARKIGLTWFGVSR